MKTPLLALAPLLLAASLSAAPTPGRGFVLTPGPGTTPDDLNAALHYILHNTEILAAVGQPPLAPNEKQILLFRDPTSPSLGTINPTTGTATLNLSILERDGAPTPQTRRRIGQALLRHLAVLLNEPPCPFPLCVLNSDCVGTDCLDNISGNYCPPCRDRINHAAEKLGMPLQPPTEN